MYCRKCGKAIPSDSIFCPSCGERVIQASAIKEEREDAKPTRPDSPSKAVGVSSAASDSHPRHWEEMYAEGNILGTHTSKATEAKSNSTKRRPKSEGSVATGAVKMVRWFDKDPILARQKCEIFLYILIAFCAIDGVRTLVYLNQEPSSWREQSLNLVVSAIISKLLHAIFYYKASRSPIEKSLINYGQWGVWMVGFMGTLWSLTWLASTLHGWWMVGSSTLLMLMFKAENKHIAITLAVLSVSTGCIGMILIHKPLLG